MRYKEFKIIVEATLQPSELFQIKHINWRPAAFLKKLQDRTPFIKSQTGEKVIPSKGEFERLQKQINDVVKAKKNNPTAPSINFTIKTDKGEFKISDFEKADLQMQVIEDDNSIFSIPDEDEKYALRRKFFELGGKTL
jgi:hypothetical protein